MHTKVGQIQLFLWSLIQQIRIITYCAALRMLEVGSGQ